jgi:CRP-like cAMP-binding protein
MSPNIDPLRPAFPSPRARQPPYVRHRTYAERIGAYTAGLGKALQKRRLKEPALHWSPKIVKTAIPPPHDALKNRLLACLPDPEWQRWREALEWVDMPLGHVLYESGATLSHVYFPATSIVSLLYVMENGASAEIAVVGKEGLVGISLFMGGESTPSRAVVQSAGYGYRLKAQSMKDEFNRAGSVLHLLLRYTQALITQMSQTAVCNRHHSVEQQLCRWLLLTLDRLPRNDLTMTQELIANMLGVRREGVTEAAGRLQGYGYISYRRGHITVLDRKGLEADVCECYQVVKKEFARLLSDVRNRQENVPS